MTGCFFVIRYGNARVAVQFTRAFCKLLLLTNSAASRAGTGFYGLNLFTFVADKQLTGLQIKGGNTGGVFRCFYLICLYPGGGGCADTLSRSRPRCRSSMRVTILIGMIPTAWAIRFLAHCHNRLERGEPEPFRLLYFIAPVLSPVASAD